MSNEPKPTDLSTLYLVVFQTKDGDNYTLCSDYGKAVISCMAAIIEKIDDTADDGWQHSIIADVVNNRHQDAIDNFNLYHQEHGTGISVGFSIVEPVGA